MKARSKTPSEIDSMRRCGAILYDTLHELARHVKQGITTRELALMTRELLHAAGAKPVLLGYNGFPDVICISVNDALVHGIPGDYALQAGDLVGLDLEIGYEGMITDSAITVPVGKTTARTRRLLEGAQQALQAGVVAAKDGNRVGDISSAIQAVLQGYRLGIIQDLCGHGVGYAVHEDPIILNFGEPNTGMVLKSGMTLAIEPMASLGSYEVYEDTDGWTIRTRDGTQTAQFEHTVVVTNTGGEILTQP